MNQRVLAGKTAIVTGAGHGLGRGIARGLAAAGADVAILEKDEVSAAESCAELEAMGANALAINADVADSAQVDAAFARVMESFGHLDVLVNNAGISRAGPETQPRRSSKRVPRSAYSTCAGSRRSTMTQIRAE